MSNPVNVDLFGDLPAPVRYTGPLSIEHVPTVDRCPRCGATISEQTVEQPALMVAAGHGATEKRVTRTCQSCPWWTVAEISECKPGRP